MGIHRAALALATIVLLSGCAVFDPFVRHAPEADRDRPDNCHAGIADDEALEFACNILTKMERNRSSITRTRAGMTTALFPIAGIIGYNAARDMNAATNAAMAAGGVAGYGVVTTLAQPDRIRIYNEGIRSIQCATGVYGLAVHPPQENLSKSFLQARLGAARTNIGAFNFSSHATQVPVSIQRARTEMFLDTMQRMLNKASPPPRLQVQLVDLVHDTMAAVNVSLNSTIADTDSALAAQLMSRLGGGSPSGEQDAEALNIMLSSAPAAFEDEANTLLRLLQQYRDAPAQSADADFSGCKFNNPANLGTKAPITQLTLGGGNWVDGEAQPVLQGQKYDVPVFGGQSPYRAQMTSTPEGAAPPQVEVNGALVSVTFSSTQARGDYTLLVWDASGWQHQKAEFEVVEAK